MAAPKLGKSHLNPNLMFVVIAFNASDTKVIIAAKINIVVGAIAVFIDVQIFFGQIAISDHGFLLGFFIRDRLL